jgi:hypothetical protein
MLDESYIVKLPRLKRNTSEIFDRSPEHLRWLWYSWSAKLLGWRQRLPEGHPKGFSPAVYSALRDVISPFPRLRGTTM